MSTFIFVDNWLTTLASPASSGATTLTFSQTVPTIAAGQILPITLNDAATGAVFEVVYATANSGSNATVIRGQEGTAAVSWLASDNAYAPGATSGTLGAMQQTNVPIKTNSPLQFVDIASDTISNFSTLTQINVTPFSIPAGAITQGAVLRVIGRGEFAVGSPTTISFQVKVGSHLFGSIVNVANGNPYAVSGPNGGWVFSTTAICTLAGSSGNLRNLIGLQSLADIAGPSSVTGGAFTTQGEQSTSINTTIANTVTFWAAFGAASVSNTVTMDNCSIEIIYPQNVVT